ncbi:MAG: hypothetical protein KKE39_11290 [Bacteroidetes bacterium]|nr:hypothetical protein [Bacteroidota bacterium]MBU1372197.1 hypothetical protein [Bacteroidota bacterium]MBU1483325.1 hypothetical protein [Bacteroidota bacterium]MBU1760433.1 hypothetical protein [Bacteroidota bacterium]MBU2046465.1 hypothetical protein [Bacteroidota bacterium]
MSDRFKKIFLGVSIAVPFLLYCIYYYSFMIKNAPYKFSEFKSITMKSGIGNHYDKIYTSTNEKFQYLNGNDSLITHKLKLSKDDLLYLHRRAADIGMWDMPTKMLSDTTNTAPKYYIELDYERKKKIIEFDAAFNGNPKLKDAAIELVKTVEKVIETADEKQNH